MQNSKVYILAKSTFVEGMRHKALWTIVALAVIMSLGNIIFTEMFSWDLGKISIEFGLSAFAFTGLLLVLFLGIKILADDIDFSRIHMTLARPVSLWQYTIGKFTGLSLTLLATAFIMALSSFVSMKVVLINYSAWVPPNFSWVTFAMAFSTQLMSLIMVLSTSFFFFSFASNHFAALLMTVFTYLLGQNMELLRKTMKENPHAEGLSDMQWLVEAISWVIPNLSYFDKKYEAAYGFPVSNIEFLLLIGYCTSYSLICLYFSTLFLSRRDFN